MQEDDLNTTEQNETAQEAGLPPRGLGEREETPDGGMTVGDAVPDMPPGAE